MRLSTWGGNIRNGWLRNGWLRNGWLRNGCIRGGCIRIGCLRRIPAAVLPFVLLFTGMQMQFPRFHADTADRDVTAVAEISEDDSAVMTVMTMTSAPSTAAAAAVLYEPESGHILLGQNETMRLPMASTTKIMTALVVLRICDLADIVTVPEEAAGTEGSSMYLEKGERYTVEALLYGLMLASANDAAVALATHAAGSTERFAALMNAEARRMGLRDTHFVTVNGLDDENHYTTAAELALIAAEALKVPTFAKIVSCESKVVVSTAGRRCFLSNHNRLLREYDGCIGVKTGYTMRSGRCLVTAARRDGMTLIAVTLSDRQDWKDHRALFDYGFAAWQKVILAEANALRFDTPLGKVTNPQPVTALLQRETPLSGISLTVDLYDVEKDGVCGMASFQVGKNIYTARLRRVDS